MAKKKQKCPYCGKYFVYLSRHKCALAPENDTTAKTTKKKTSAKATKKKKSISKKSSSSKTSRNSASSSSSRAKSSSVSRSKKKSNQKRRSYSEIDKEILMIIKQNKKLYFDELTQKTEIDEKTVEKSIKRLSTKQKISVRSDMKEGVRTELIRFLDEYEIQDDSEVVDKNEDIVWETLGDCPCFLCPEVNRCNKGQNELNPIYCEHLVKWINCNLNDQPFKNPFKGIEVEKKKK